MKDRNKNQKKETSTSANQIKKSGANYKDLNEGFRLIIENTTDIILQTTLTGKFTYISPSCERIADYKPEEMIGKSFTKFVPKKELPRYFSKIKEMISGKKIDNFETYVVHKDGHLISVEFSGQIVKIKNRSFINGVLRDITKRKHVEKELQESESQLKKFVENSPIGIYRTTPDGKIIMANPALVHMLGYSSFKEFSKWDLESALYHPAYPRKQFKKRIEKDKKIIGLESTWTKKDGSTLFIRENASTIYDADGGICCYEGTVENLTRQKEIERSLRKSEENYRILVENQTDIVFKIDCNMEFLYVNPSYCNLFGKKEKDLLGKKYLSLIHKDDCEKTRKAFDKTCKPPYMCYVEHRAMTKDGWRWIALSNKSILDSDNNIMGIIGIGRDITKQKKAEIELSRTKEFLQNVIDSATEFILTFDIKGKVSFWNKSAERITGFKAQQIIGRRPTMLEVFDKPKELEDYLNEAFEGKMSTFDDLLLKTKGGRKKLIKTTNSIMRNEGKQPIGILFIGKDISRESEIHGKLLSGTSYLIINENIEPALDLFIDLTISNYDGLFITRDSLNKMQSIFPSIDVDVVELSQENIEGVDCVYDPDTLTVKIEEFSSKHFQPIILFDRIDYLLSNFSFEKVIKTIYKINDIVALNNAILLLRLNPTIIDERQLAIIEEEIKRLPSQKIANIKLEDEIYDILTYIYEQDKRNMLVSFQKISREFSISKATTAKRADSLKEKDLIFIKKRGKAKTMHVSEKGKALLNKRKAA